MARKKKADEKTPREIELFINLQWEFIRRNPEYKKDYEKCEKDYEKCETWRERSLPGIDNVISIGIRGERHEILDPFIEKWGILPVDPEFDLSKRTPNKSFIKGCFPFPIEVQGPVRAIERNKHREVLDGHGKMPPEKAILVVDLRYPMRVLEKNFKLIIDEEKEYYGYHCMEEDYRGFCSEREAKGLPLSETQKEILYCYGPYEKPWKIPMNPKNKKLLREYDKYCEQTRKRWWVLNRHYQDPDLYKTYLRVWDLREKENKSWRQIQRALDLNSVQTARDHYNAVKILIMECRPL